ncbi:large ribosomal subunit protein mL38-like isoform X1 [Macrobrachium nipponense]|uniref:large ribosomal subunit protein mL38-like isoform X1 n=1 Tax=Macrobrachium nipponense TaxID=159736 RepID=UPI0030C892A4
MARLWSGKLFIQRHNVILQQVRNKWINKIKVDIYPSLEERLAERDETKKDPQLYAPVNIGFTIDKKSRMEQISERVEKVKSNKRDRSLEKLAKKWLLKVDLDAVQKEWETTTAPTHLKTLAEHYGIFSDLFGLAYFIPHVYMKVTYDYDENTESVVYRGNVIKPSEAVCQPHVEFSSKPDDLWTLILTNPDGNLYDNDKECLHWFVGNIPGGDVSKGDVICDYLQPFPPRGVGYQRMVFLLYKQESTIDFSKYQKHNPCLELRERTFSTLDFYHELQDEITPAGVAWFQSDWDSTLTNVFHKKLNMREPIYEYDFPPPYITAEKYFPVKKPFNEYMDRYKHPKELNKEILLQRLAKINPLEGDPPVLQFPSALPIDNTLPSWYKREIKRERLGVGKYRDLFRGRNRPPQILDENIEKFEIEYETDKPKRHKY